MRWTGWFDPIQWNKKPFFSIFILVQIGTLWFEMVLGAVYLSTGWYALVRAVWGGFEKYDQIDHAPHRFNSVWGELGGSVRFNSKIWFSSCFKVQTNVLSKVGPLWSSTLNCKNLMEQLESLDYLNNFFKYQCCYPLAC